MTLTSESIYHRGSLRFSGRSLDRRRHVWGTNKLASRPSRIRTPESDDERPNRSPKATSRSQKSTTGRWRSGQSFHYPLSSSKQDPWETCCGLVQDYDQNLSRMSTEEVQNLLIFAGLFSAVVVSFTVNTFKMLQSDLVTAAGLVLPPSPDFKPSMAVVRINIYLFISMSFSLTTVLVGTLCTQWLREYRHYDSLTHRDALLLRQMRHEGLVKWKVPTILSLLPTLLQTALILFFAGVLELLWSLNVYVTIAFGTSAGLTLIFLLFTTFAPAFQYYMDRREATTDPSSPQCPYKSPQSWAVLQIEIYVILVLQRLRRCISELYNCCDEKIKPKSKFSSLIAGAHDWFRFDLTWSRKRRTHGGITPSPVNLDLVSSLRWVASTFIESKDAAEAVYGCIRDLDPAHMIAALSMIERRDISLLEQMCHTTNYLTLTRSEDGKALLADQASYLILEHFVKENPQFDLPLLRHRVELYTRSSTESMRMFCMGLPGMRCPDISRYKDHLCDDLKIQLLLYVESLLTNQSSGQPYVASYMPDLKAGWHVVSTVIRKDPLLEDLNGALLQAVASYLTANKQWFTMRNLTHVKESRLYSCLSEVFVYHVELRHFYNLLRQNTERTFNDTIDLMASIQDLVRGLEQANTFADLPHPLLRTESWCQLVSMCGPCPHPARSQNEKNQETGVVDI